MLGTIFLFAYLVIYVVAPHLPGYSMIGVFVVAVAAGIGMRVREMMRRQGTRFMCMAGIATRMLMWISRGSRW